MNYFLIASRFVQNMEKHALSQRRKSAFGAAGLYIRTISGFVNLRGMIVHTDYTIDDHSRLKPVVEMLNGVLRTADEKSQWDNVAERMSSALKGKKCRIEAATLSPTKKHLVACCEVSSLLAFVYVRLPGFILSDQSIVGRIPEGSRQANNWRADR